MINKEMSAQEMCVEKYWMYYVVDNDKPKEDEEEDND
jgi:hypothetical protein|tara:strand:+ start:461 stop:571 length:111 start_codon:yes stop_codon:yes gene_type:complete